MSSEKKDMNSYFREKFGTDRLQKVQSMLGHQPTTDGNQDVNAYFREKYGSDNLEQVQTKLEQARARGELPPSQPVRTVEKIIEKEVLTTRTPNWAQEDNILVTGVESKTQEQITAEIQKRQAEAAERLRSKIMIEGDEEFFFIYGRPPQRTVEIPVKTLAEERARAEKKSGNAIKELIFSINARIAAIKNARTAKREMIARNHRSLYDYPDNPTQKVEIQKTTDGIMQASTESFEKMDKAVPYLEEIKEMYEQVLDEKIKTEAVQQAKMPQTLKEMEKLTKEAAKLYSKVVKLAGEYQETGIENSLERLAVVVEEYIDLQSQWSERKRELYGLDPQPQFPPMPDLPALPRKLWKKIQES